jgi:hypothetical protein
MKSLQRFAWAITLVPSMIGSSTLSSSALADEVKLPDKYAEVVLDVEGMI